MNYATQYYIGYNQNPTATQTTDFAQTIGRVRPVDAKTKGCKRNTKRQIESRLYSHATNGFLRCSFLPKLQETKNLQASGKPEKTERNFYQSLSKLAEHYGIQPMQSREYGYPYNIALALNDAQEQLGKNIRDWEEIRLRQDCGKTFFTSEERYNTGATLYYIPIVPLYRLSKKTKRRKTVLLLQSVCSYLYHIADVPYYRQEESYLYWMYDMVGEWLTSDEDNEDASLYLSEIKQIEWIGDFMERKIYNRHNLSLFKEHLDNFKSKDGFDNDCFELALKAFELYRQFPNTAIHRNAHPNGEAVDEDEDFENSVSMDRYVSFCADTKGVLFQNLFDSVNSELQEYAQMDEPIILKHFDGSDIPHSNLDFENRVFPLMEELIYLLDSF